MAKTLLKELVFKKTTKAEIESGTLPDGKFYIPTDDTVAFMSDLETKQDKGDYATNTALQQGLATKQPVGNYATEEELTQGLAGKADKATTLEGYGITDGATKTELNTKLSTVATDGKTITGNGTTSDPLTVAKSGTGLDIGDIIYTTRTDNELSGKVECNGAQYNFADVNGGDNNVQSLLENGSLPYLPIAEFDAMVSEQGGCDSFGYGIDTKWAQWQAQSGYVYTKTENYEVGDPVYDAIDGNIIGNITTIDKENRTYIVYEDTDGASGSALFYDMVNGPVDSTPYFKVPKKLGRVLVRSQKPTADNNYTWYNLYSDGWVEQGGYKTISTGGSGTVSLSITMADTNYSAQMTPAENATGLNPRIAIIKTDLTTTTITLHWYSYNAGQQKAYWQVSGYAAASEYTKDKWDYQNIQVERPMVQLFNGATDEALATCTGVLADIAGLKDMNNITSTGKETVVGWGMPDYSAGVDISNSLKNANSSWTAPLDGTIIAKVNNNDSVYLFRKSGCVANNYNSASEAFININGEQYAYLTDNAVISKGETICASSENGVSGKLYFYPFKGAN